MNRPITIVLFLCLFLAGGWQVYGQQQTDWVIEPTSEDGWLEWDWKTELTTATNGVKVKYGEATLISDRVSLNQKTGDAYADGHVRIQRDEQLWVGEHVLYNFHTRRMEAENFRSGKSPLFISGQGLHTELNNSVYLATNSYVTTDDIKNPFLKVRAKSIRIIPGKRIEARQAVLWIGGVPVFYFPFYSRSLDARANNFSFIPGYRSAFGPFLLGSYNWFLNDELDGTVHVDYRERRGLGAGPDVNYHLGRWGSGTMSYYYMHDDDPNRTFTNGIPENRQRLFLSYHATPWTNLDIKAMVRYQGDRGIVREFFEGEYRRNPQPSTFVEVTKNSENWDLNSYVQPRVNDFLETVERLPDIRLTGFRQQIAETPFYYESESSAGYYRRLFAETNGIPDGLKYSAGRVDTYHQIVMPETFFGWLNFIPRVGGRFTHYTETEGPGSSADERNRGVFNTGAELNFKASQTWPGIENKFFQMDGVRHVIEPSVNYVYVPAPSVRPQDLPQFDFQLPSLRLLPIEFPDYNSIDSVDSQNVVRLGLRNRLQTKRNGELVNFLNWDLYTDWRLRPHGDQSDFEDVFSDLTIKPRSWLTLESVTRYDADSGQFRLSLHTATLQPNENWAFTVGHYYLRADNRPAPIGWGEGENVLTDSIFYKINENYGLRATHHFNVRDGRMQEQFYSVYRDMRSWTAALTFGVRDNRTHSDDFTVAFTFSIKAFPRFGLGADSVKPYYLLGR